MKFIHFFLASDLIIGFTITDMKPLKILKGLPFPYGATVKGPSVNFSIFTEEERIKLCLYNLDNTPSVEIPLNSDLHKTGSVRHVEIEGMTPPFYYGYKTSTDRILLDPYAKSTSSSCTWGASHTFLGVVDIPEDTDSEDRIRLDIPPSESIIYEMHVRAFTADGSSRVAHPGTFLGLIEKIPYLVDLGINAVELLPVQEFDESEYRMKNPLTQERLYNFWGYSTLNYFALTNRYATENAPSAARREFKMLVRELHKNGIEVILDVVFNHTGEGNEKGPTYSFKGLADSTYYLRGENSSYSDYTGCGNTLNCNHPTVIEMILDSLRYWVTEMHVDGFRFDLTTIFYRGLQGEPLDSPPLITAISLDPVLAKTKLIAEPWDAAGLYRLGNIYSETDRWSEWNDRYRNTFRRFIKGTPGTKTEFATCLCGSEPLFYKHNPFKSINFITCHDGFTLHDLVSYNHKHNESNGENNRDGNSFNDSWNCGIEGTTDDEQIIDLRNRQMRNFHTALMLSQGIPMLHMGDEYGHSKKGNNNTWCQDNELNWFSWERLKENADFFRFYRLMIAFRKQQKLLKNTKFLTDQDIDWHGSRPYSPQWNKHSSLLAFTLKSHDLNEAIYAAFNAQDSDQEIELPESPTGTPWLRVVDTAAKSPSDIFEPSEYSPVTATKYLMTAHSAIVLIASI